MEFNRYIAILCLFARDPFCRFAVWFSAIEGRFVGKSKPGKNGSHRPIDRRSRTAMGVLPAGTGRCLCELRERDRTNEARPRFRSFESCLPSPLHPNSERSNRRESSSVCVRTSLDWSSRRRKTIAHPPLRHNDRPMKKAVFDEGRNLIIGVF